MTNCCQDLLPKISDGVEVYANRFKEEIYLSAKYPFIMQESIQCQNYDFMFAALIDGQAKKKAFIVFGDLKSANNISPTTKLSSKKNIRLEIC
jgi:hypothetical protein